MFGFGKKKNQQPSVKVETQEVRSARLRGGDDGHIYGITLLKFPSKVDIKLHYKNRWTGDAAAAYDEAFLSRIEAGKEDYRSR